MPLLQQRISNLLGGVSQRPLVEMFQNQLQSSDNWIARLTYGLVKRPPFTYVAKLTSTLTGVDSAFMFAINRSEDERYRVIVRDGTIVVLDADDGAAVTVEDRSAGSYLDAVSGKSYRAVTVGDETFIVNQGVTVAKGTEKSDAKLHEALVTVEQADFSTLYIITVEGQSGTYRTLDADSPYSRRSIATDFIAFQILQDLSPKLPHFTFTLMGSTIHISYSADFSIDVSDGLGDNGLFLVKGEVETIEDLNRTRAPHGTKVKVLGSRGTDSDDYWVRYDSSGADASEDSSWGIWKETVAPSTLLNVDADTMPHKLVYQQSKLGEELGTKSFPKAPTLSGGAEGAATGGWTEDETGAGRTAANGGSVSTSDEGFQAPIPGADGNARTVTVRYHIYTVDVDPGIVTYVSLEHDIDGGGSPTIHSAAYERGVNEWVTVEVEKDFAVADKLRLIMSDNRQETFDQFNAPAMSVGGSGDDPAPISANTPKGITLTVTPGTYFEGLQVKATIDTIDFTYAVQDGDDADAIATGLAALINANATYTSSATDNVIAVEVTADSTTDITFGGAEVGFIANTAVLELPEGLTLSITEDEFVGDELINITDGSSGTITANDTAGLFTVDAFAGGSDSTVSPGDILTVEGTGAYFVFQPVAWATRKVGDTTSNPWPSFVRREINDVFFFRNRLGFLTGAHVVLSESGKRANFFRSTVIDVLDSGRIDIESAHPEVADFQHSIVWNRNLFLWSDSAQYELGGEPVLSPKTVRLDVLSRFSNSRKVPPLILGRRILFAHQQQGHVRIYEWAPPTDAEPVFQAIDITKEVPTYMPGQVVQMAGDYGHGLMALICDGDQDAIYIYSYADNPDGSQVFGAWQRATLPTGATARQLVFVDGKLSVITSYADGIFLDEGDYDQPAAGDDDDVIFLDRQLEDPALLDSLGSFDSDIAVRYRGDEITDNGSGFSDTWPNHVASPDYDLVGDGAGADDGPEVAIGGTPTGENHMDWADGIFFSERLFYDDSAHAIDLSGEMTLWTVVRLSSASTAEGFVNPITGDIGRFGFAYKADQTPNQSNNATCTFKWGVCEDGTTGDLRVFFNRGGTETAVGFAKLGPVLQEDTWYVIGFRLGSSGDLKGHHLWVNGVSDTTDDTYSGGTDTDFLGVGAHKWITDSGIMQMDQAEFMVFTEALSDAKMDVISALLTKKYLDAGQEVATLPDWPYEENGDGETTEVGGTTYAGLPIEARARLAPFYLRDDQGAPETGGRLQVRRMDVEYNRTQDLKVEVTPAGRSKYTHTIDEATLQQGERRVPILSRGEDTVIELVSDGTGDARVSSIDAEFFYHNRSRRT